MSHTYIEVRGYPHPAEPRGARLVDLIAGAVRALFAPARPAVPSRAAEALAVRQMAAKLAATDPSFASDLLAAAMRHEALDDEPGAR